MTYTEFASDLPLERTLAFRSAEENQETMDRLGVPQHVRQLGTGAFRANLIVRGTDQADLFADRFNRACSMYLEPPRGMVGLLIFRSAGGEFLSSGESVANDKLVVMPDGSGADLVLPDLGGSDALTMPANRFTEMTEALCPTARRPEKTAVIEGNTAQLQVLRRALLDLVTSSEPDPDPERLSNLLAATIAWMAQASPREGVYMKPVRVHIAKAAQEFIEEHYRETVRMEDICRETGVGVRTLQRCFRDYFGITLAAYLKTVRLDAAHRALAAADPVLDSVTDIALHHGFTHLGRFSVEFRRRFGDRPSETLGMRNGR